MKMAESRYIYGPVPSRRLGRSLGIDLVPFKACTYDCVYCQLGRTTARTIARREDAPVPAILEELEERLSSGPTPEYISLAGSGEPTLHGGIGRLIAGIKRITRIPVAVITNGSLLWEREVADALMSADLVVPSLDAGDAGMFERINRPHPAIGFDRMVDGLADFAGRFPGPVWLEVMLLAGLNDNDEATGKIARLTARVRPARIQLNTVSRPPSEETARAVDPEAMSRLSAAFAGRAEIIPPSSPGSAADVAGRGMTGGDILALLARRPCTVEDIAAGLGEHRLSVLKQLEHLTAAGRVKSVLANGRRHYAATDERT